MKIPTHPNVVLTQKYVMLKKKKKKKCIWISVAFKISFFFASSFVCNVGFLRDPF